MRILLVSDHYPPPIGGAERQTRLLAEMFTEQGHEVAVAAPWVRDSLRECIDDGIRVFRVRQLRTALPWLIRSDVRRHAPPYPDPVTILELRRVVARFRPDVVHSHGWMTYSIAPRAARGNTPLLITARDYGYFCANRMLLRDGRPCDGPQLAKCLGCAGRYFGVPKGWVAVAGVLGWRPLLRRNAAGFHSISTYVAQRMEQHLFHDADGGARRPQVLRFVIPSFRRESQTPEATLAPYLQALPTEPFILFVGQFRHMKGVDVLIDAYGRLESPPPLVMIGNYSSDGPREFPPSVTVLTDVPNEAVLASWPRALFGVTPSLGPEPLGSVVHEGMSRGKPIIATNHGGYTDMIVDGQTGLLVPPGDVGALTAAMRELIDNAEKREQLGRAAKGLADQFSADVIIPRFARVYEEVSKVPSTARDS